MTATTIQTAPADAGTRARRTWLVIAAVAVAVPVGVIGLTLKLADGSHHPFDTALSVLGWLLFLGAGVVAHLLRPANRTGLLMILVGVAFAAEDLQLSTVPAVYTLGLLLAHGSTPVVAHLVLAFPHGRLESRSAVTLATAAYAVVGTFSLVETLFVDRVRVAPGKPENLLLVADLPRFGAVLGAVFSVAGVLVAGGVLVVLSRRFLTGGREIRVPVAPALLVATIASVASATGSAMGPLHPGYQVGVFVWRVAFCLWPLAFLLGVVWVRPRRVALTDLIMAVHGPATAGQLRETLATVLRDPSLRLGVWRPETDTFVDTDGRPVDPGEGALLLTGNDGHPVGLLTHSDASWVDVRLAEAVAGLAGVVLENQKLAAEAAARLAEVHASRARLVTAADDERRRVERDLHDGAQQRLVTVALGIARARQLADGELAELLTVTADTMTAAIDELRELARGIHPVLLAEAGLGPAVADLADRTPLPVGVSAPDLPRLPAPTEATAYFVVAEALTNVLKHAGASRADVRLSLVEGRLRVEVADDGAGTATVTTGSGLGGLRDRVRALDGELTVTSTPGSGTAVTAEIPAR